MMDAKKLEKLLKEVKRGAVSIEAALSKFKDFPIEDIGFARIDTHRHLRRGFPEVIFGQGKTEDQVIKIAKRMKARKEPIFITRASESLFKKIKRIFKNARYHELAQAVTVLPHRPKMLRSGVLVITAGTSDIPVAEEAALTAELMGEKVERVYDVGVAGLHRLVSVKEKILKANIIVVVAGMEGALPSVVAGLIEKPVIGVPTSTGYGTSFKGIAALLGMLNSCSSGLLVVNIDNGFGAGYAASLINRMVS